MAENGIWSYVHNGYSFATNYRRLPIIATRKNIHTSVMATHFESFLLCICSIHFGNSYTLFVRLGMLLLVKLYLFEFPLAIIGTRR